MLTLVREETAGVLHDFCKRDVFGARISSFAAAYGYAYPFANFWIQTVGVHVTAAVSRVDGMATLCSSDSSDVEELRAFLQAVGYSALQCSQETAAYLRLRPQNTGPYLCADVECLPAAYLPAGIRLERMPPLKEVFALLCTCGQLDGVGETQWIADISHRIRHSVAQAVALSADGQLCACAFCLAQTSTQAILGAVATIPQHRRRGMGRFLISLLTRELAGGGRRVFLLREAQENESFYDHLGYRPAGNWATVVPESGLVL